MLIFGYTFPLKFALAFTLEFALAFSYMLTVRLQCASKLAFA